MKMSAALIDLQPMPTPSWMAGMISSALAFTLHEIMVKTPRADAERHMATMIGLNLSELEQHAAMHGKEIRIHDWPESVKRYFGGTGWGDTNERVEGLLHQVFAVANRMMSQRYETCDFEGELYTVDWTDYRLLHQLVVLWSVIHADQSNIMLARTAPSQPDGVMVGSYLSPTWNVTRRWWYRFSAHAYPWLAMRDDPNGTQFNAFKALLVAGKRDKAFKIFSHENVMHEGEKAFLVSIFRAAEPDNLP